MSIIQQIKDASLVARKNRDRESASLLTTLLSEAEMVGKNAGRETTDAEAVAVIKKFVKNNNETMSRVTDESVHSMMELEIRLLEAFLPKQLSDAEITQKMREILNADDTCTNMGVLLKVFKTKYEGQYDGGMAAKIAKTFF